MYRYLALLIIFVMNPFVVVADTAYLATVGLESYYMIRNRDGGTNQGGVINGVKITLDRLKCYGWYIGADYLYAHGRLNGETASGRPLKSLLTDQIVELRLGFTLQQKVAGSPFITPFGGWGYFREVNDFYPPSPLSYTFTDTFNYVAAGFLSGVNFTPLLSMGINFKLRFMQNAKSEVSDDPMYDNVTLMMNDEMHVRLDIPFMYTPGNSLWGIGFLLSPFFEYRHFGGREGFPFNFKDTKFYLYGARFALTYRF
jgi:hypothetical protein